LNDIKFKLEPGHASDLDWMKPRGLHILSWNLTHKCNFVCDLCFSDSGTAASDELTTDEAKAMLDNARKAGVTYVVLSGGEPLIRKDFLELADHMSELGMRMGFASNGSLFTDEILDHIARKNPKASFQISVDTLDRQAYEKVHGVSSKMLDRAINSLHLIKQHGFHTTVSVRLAPVTLPGIPNLLDRALQEGWPTVTIHCPIISGRQKNIWPPETDLLQLLEPTFEHFLSMQKHWVVETTIPWARYHPVIQGLAKRIKVTHAGCTASRFRIAVQADGGVTSCLCADGHPWLMGNVRNDDLQDLFNESSHSRLFRKPWEHGICSDCEHLRECGGGCRVMAYGITGKMNADDPTCPLRKKFVQNR
jgi:radical SAM protein with 4Fe4S-binding SPASM domain